MAQKGDLTPSRFALNTATTAPTATPELNASARKAITLHLSRHNILRHYVQLIRDSESRSSVTPRKPTACPGVKGAL